VHVAGDDLIAACEPGQPQELTVRRAS
jgi:hypothetical protein